MSASGWLFLGWALHYFPFYGMGRVLYFHHYFPAAIFSSMLSAVIVDYLLKVLPVLFLHVVSRGGGGSGEEEEKRTLARYEKARMLFHVVYGSLLAALAYSFYLFSPLAYGIIRLPTSASVSGLSTNGSMSGINGSTGLNNSLPFASNMSDSTSAPTSEYVDYSQERSMASLRWMDSWEF